jgi:hypothetical protein
MIVDIDDQEIAAQFMAEDSLVLRDTLVSRTQSGGCHIWLWTWDGKTAGVNLVRAGSNGKGGRVGELRGDGQYCVEPPSTGPFGPYEFLNPDIAPKGVGTEDESVYDYVFELFEGVDVALRPMRSKADRSAIENDDSDLPAIECPFPRTGFRELNQHLSGTMPNHDRSKELFKTGILLVNASKHARDKGKLEHDLTLDEIAGVLKTVDRIAYRKYAGRADGDVRYRMLAQDVMEAVEKSGVRPLAPFDYVAEWDDEADDGFQPDLASDSVPEAGSAAEQTARLHGISSYTVDLSRGTMYFPPEVKKPTLVCNFLPTVDEELEVSDGDGGVCRAYKVRCRHVNGDDERIVRLEPEDFVSERRLKAAFMNALPSHFSVEADGWKHLVPAMQQLSDRPQRRQLNAYTGCVRDRSSGPMFVMPGADGAITSAGVDLATRYYEHDELTPGMRQYGVGVRPVETEVERQRACEGFVTALRSAPAEISVPVMLQIFAGPLASLGVQASPPTVHLHGQTGSQKTAFTLTMMSFFGRFGEGYVTETWMSTINKIRHSLYLARDLTLHVDDYKAGYAHLAQGQTVGLVQNYGDRTARGRLTPSQTAQKTTLPRGLLLSTGEDLWSGDQSQLARVIVIPIPRGKIVPDEHAMDNPLRKAQRCAADGTLALVGGTYLQWMATKGLDNVEAAYKEQRVAVEDSIRGNGRWEISHGRSITSLASLIAVERIVSAFLKERLPEAYEEFCKAASAASRALLENAVSDSTEAAAYSPFDALRDEIQSAIEANEARFELRDPKTVALNGMLGIGGGPYSTLIGYFDVHCRRIAKSSRVRRRISNRYCLSTMRHWTHFADCRVSSVTPQSFSGATAGSSTKQASPRRSRRPVGCLCSICGPLA